MHGRPRKAETALSKEELEASALKASKLHSLQSQFLHFHQNKIYTKEALEVSAKLLEANPEYYTAWNYRKLAVNRSLNENEAPIGSDSIKSILDEELRLVETALKKNYKCYGAWYHRKWVLSKGHSSTDRELLLLGKFQKADSRNFHAWNYRRFVTAMKNIPAEDELQYTTDMIYDNFSNYSAWHNRSVILSHLLKQRVHGYYPMENVLTEEYDFVRHALFTDPDDQSGWFYHLWLLDQTVKMGSLLVSSWPPHGSAIYTSTDGVLDDFALPPITRMPANAKGFPLILYFSEAVANIDSSTVKVECENNLDDQIVWQKVLTDEHGCSRTWLAQINLPSEELPLSKSYKVKVNIVRPDGIPSSSGVYHACSTDISFVIHFSPQITEIIKVKELERFYWEDENFFLHQLQLQESAPLNSQQIIASGDHERVADWNLNTISNEIVHCRELLSTMNCKIGKLTLARLLMAHDTLMSYQSSNVQDVNHYDEVLGLYSDLMKLDPTHVQYYKDQYSLVVIKQVTSKRDLLLKYCRQYRNQVSSSINDFCLRLTCLSLTRIGSIEQLLWVQILDLSHNELRSIEGLEAMQLLSCLNLSSNKLINFTALEPLRLVKSLKVLNISCNEIGAHSIDSRRFLFSSPLSHTSSSDWKIEDFTVDGVKMTDYWEAFLVFRDLNLIQLDIAGNAVADEKLKFFLLKLLPELKWYDGEEIQ